MSPLTPDEAWSVAKLAGTIKRRVEEGFEPVWVRGELVGVKRYPSGHWYFSLRDDLAKVDCTLWKFAAQRLTQPLQEGVEVIALGTANVWEERTSLRFNVTQIIPASAVGAQAQAVERIRQALAADGLLDPARKRPLPPFPQRIAVVTSIAGAAVRDIITVAHRRWPGIHLLVVNSAVQGSGAPAELVAALRTVALIPDVDCCIIGRGGGGKEDLAAFNDESLCRAIAACPVPVISAVGHEVDVTLADLVADLRAATPSQAAEFVLPERTAVEAAVRALGDDLISCVGGLIALRRDRLQRTRDRMGHALTGQLREAERRLSRIRERLAPSLARQVQQPKQRLTRLGDRLRPAVQRRLERVRSVLQRRAGQLDALSPLKVLSRGYAMVRTPDGRILRKVSDFTLEQPFNLTVTDGTVSARVEPS